jgi:uncharacterized protein (TIGR03067 family)
MRLWLLVFTVFLFVPTLSVSQDEQGGEDLKKLQGSWDLKSIEREGKPLAVFAGAQWKVKGNKIETIPVVQEFSVKLGSDKKWRTIDRTFLADVLGGKNPQEGKVIRGIYKLEGDTLTVCESEVDGPRPEEFNSKGKRAILVLKRSKK